MSPPAESFPDLARRAKLRLLQMHYQSGVGHIGGNLSCLDLLLCLYHRVLSSDDAFVLSKGHAAGALYITLWTLGRLSDDDLLTFHKDGTRLSGHPPASGIPEILFATGSLGHGLSLSCGLALAKQIKQQPGRVYCLMSDGEWNEGACWEALIFARQQHLDNLTLVVDLNGLQGFGTTREVADLAPLGAKFREFQLHTQEIDGHDPQQMQRALTKVWHGQVQSARDAQQETVPHPPGPEVIVAATHKGCGVSFMQDRMEWHYLPLDESLYRQAVQEIEQACAMSSASRS